MGADSGNADQPDETNPLAELDISPELQEELHNFSQRMMALVSEPQTHDEHGDPLPRLDMENPPITPPDDPVLQIGYALLARLPEPWASALLQVHAAADEVRVSTTVFGEDPDSFTNANFFIDLIEPCDALRRATYEPDGRGAWYGAMLWLYRNGAIRVIYNYNRPPFGTWGPREVELLRRDQELYPRDPEHLPDWHPSRSDT